MQIAAAQGSELVARKSRLARQMYKLTDVHRVLIVDDNLVDARHVTAILHLLLGRRIVVAHYKSIPAAIAAMRNQQPDLMFLDDVLPPLDRAESSMRSLRRHGFTAPFVIMTGMLTQTRRKELMALEPLGVLHKDDVDSLTVGEILIRMIPAAD